MTDVELFHPFFPFRLYITLSLCLGSPPFSQVIAGQLTYMSIFPFYSLLLSIYYHNFSLRQGIRCVVYSAFSSKECQSLHGRSNGEARGSSPGLTKGFASHLSLPPADMFVAPKGPLPNSGVGWIWSVFFFGVARSSFIYRRGSFRACDFLELSPPFCFFVERPRLDRQCFSKCFLGRISD